jgi:hypothetical protein
MPALVFGACSASPLSFGDASATADATLDERVDASTVAEVAVDAASEREVRLDLDAVGADAPAAPLDVGAEPDGSPDGPPGPCPCPALVALMKECPQTGTCVGGNQYTADQCFANGVKVRWVYEVSGIGANQQHHDVFRPDGSLCYRVHQRLAPYDFLYTDAAGRELAAMIPTFGGVRVTCDGREVGFQPRALCDDIIQPRCLEGTCAIP